METPALDLVQRVEGALGGRSAVAWRRVERGYTRAERWVVSLDDGSSCFVKAGVTPEMAHWIRQEYERIYCWLKAPFLARCLGWSDDGVSPLLLLEDLSAAHWPPPWSERQIERVLDLLRRVRSTSTDTAHVPSVAANVELDQELAGWAQVSATPAQFLSLGLASAQWLDASLSTLVAAAESVSLEGNDLVHADVRSDNLCFAGELTLLIDWSYACRGNGDIDIAFWLPSLAAEGGPPPEAILRDARGWAAIVSGYFAGRAGELPPLGAPTVRQVQLAQLKTALPWAVRALGLPPLDGPNAT